MTHCRKPSNWSIRGQKKITFSYSGPGGTLENKLNDLKPLFSHKKSLTFQKRSKKMLLHWRANLADQNTGAPNVNFRKNICSEDDLRSRIFGTFVVKFLASLPS